MTTVTTSNGYGWTNTRPNEVAEEFVERLAPGDQALDIGAAFGVATLPALARGAVVYANDLDDEHLDAIAARVPMEACTRLHLVRGRFPDEIEFGAGSLAAILASNVLHFLSGVEVELGLARAARWLRTGGSLHVLVNSPFVGNMCEVLPVFEKRLADGAAWPGEVHGIHGLCKHPSVAHVPDFIHFFTPEVLAPACERAGLRVERCDLFTRREIPVFARSATGNENLRLCATKP